MYTDVHMSPNRVPAASTAPRSVPQDMALGRSRLGVRELRSTVAQTIRRAGRGERFVITVDGIPVAELGPLAPSAEGPDLDDLLAAGLIDPPTSAERPPAPDPFPVPVDLPVAHVLQARRGRD